MGEDEAERSFLDDPLRFCRAGGAEMRGMIVAT
jgi:hypothetical protein